MFSRAGRRTRPAALFPGRSGGVTAASRRLLRGRSGKLDAPRWPPGETIPLAHRTLSLHLSRPVAFPGRARPPGRRLPARAQGFSGPTPGSPLQRASELLRGRGPTLRSAADPVYFRGGDLRGGTHPSDAGDSGTPHCDRKHLLLRRAWQGNGRNRFPQGGARGSRLRPPARHQQYL